jgi:adenylylsulfate kinase
MDKDPLKENKGFVVWLTGLSGAGKSTLAKRIYDHYAALGLRVEHLDGDSVRTVFPQTGFTKEARDEHIRRIGFLASLLERHGVIVIASFISPYREARSDVRRMCRHFIEVYVNASVDECERRDTKGLYKKARAGEIAHFTGISDPYEVPDHPEIEIRTDTLSVEGSVDLVISKIEEFIKRLKM